MSAAATDHAAHILGVSPEATFAEVRWAYHHLLFACHPDHNPGVAGELGAARVLQICLAFDVFRAVRDGGLNDQRTNEIGRRLERASANVATIIARCAVVTTLPDPRFAAAGAVQRGGRLDIAA